MTISGSVGRDGSNRTEDVRHIQRALNVSRSLDGLVPPLIVDGLVGPKTIGAITSFQTQHTRASDGRIDPAGPTIRALAERIGPRVNAEVARQIGQVAQHLQRTLMERRLALPPRASKAWGDVLASAASLSGQAPIAWDDVGPALYRPSGPPRIVLAAAPAAVLPVAAAAAEAMLLLLLALIAALVLIQAAPLMGEAIERLLRQVQIALASILEQVEEAVQGIEDLLTRNPGARMRCSDVVIKFREATAALLDALKASRPKDELGRHRYANQIAELFKKWQEAMQALLDCLLSHGAT